MVSHMVGNSLICWNEYAGLLTLSTIRCLNLWVTLLAADSKYRQEFAPRDCIL